MIKLKLEFATGEECRNALVALLGGDLSVIQGEPEIRIESEKIAENFPTSETQVSEVETPVKKRRTKAEIEAEKNAAPAQEEKDIQGEEPAKEEAKPSAITKEMLQEKAVNLIRNGKKAEVTETIKKFGADSISQADKNPVKPEDYAALMDAFNAIG